MTLYQVVRFSDDLTESEVLHVTKYEDEAQLVYDRLTTQYPYAYIDIISY